MNKKLSLAGALMSLTVSSQAWAIPITHPATLKAEIGHSASGKMKIKAPPQSNGIGHIMSATGTHFQIPAQGPLKGSFPGKSSRSPLPTEGARQVPDGGMTGALLASTLLGLSSLRRFFSAGNSRRRLA
jgi:hypothetical protein